VKVITAYVEGDLKYIAYMGHHAVMDGMSLASLKTLVDKSYKHYLAEGSFEAIEANTTISDMPKLIEVYNPSQKEHWAKPLSKVESLSVFNASNIGAQKIDEIMLDKALLRELNTLKKRHKVSTFALINAIYFSVLYRFFNFTDDIVLFETFVKLRILFS